MQRRLSTIRLRVLRTVAYRKSGLPHCADARCSIPEAVGWQAAVRTRLQRACMLRQWFEWMGLRELQFEAGGNEVVGRGRAPH
jgi:hypothetical protein